MVCVCVCGGSLATLCFQLQLDPCCGRSLKNTFDACDEVKEMCTSALESELQLREGALAGHPHQHLLKFEECILIYTFIYFYIHIYIYIYLWRYIYKYLREDTSPPLHRSASAYVHFRTARRPSFLLEPITEASN